MITFFYVMAWIGVANAVAASINGGIAYFSTGDMNRMSHEASVRMLLSSISAALFFMVAK